MDGLKEANKEAAATVANGMKEMAEVLMGGEEHSSSTATTVTYATVDTTLNKRIDDLNKRVDERLDGMSGQLGIIISMLGDSAAVSGGADGAASASFATSNTARNASPAPAATPANRSSSKQHGPREVTPAPTRRILRK